jgi:hypothetical protein
VTYVVQSLKNKRKRKAKQLSRSFATLHINFGNEDQDLCDGLAPVHADETFLNR